MMAALGEPPVSFEAVKGFGESPERRESGDMPRLVTALRARDQRLL